MKSYFLKQDLTPVGYQVRQRGASLLEGIAYLGIAAMVILGAVSLLANAFSSAQGNRTLEEVISLRTAVKKLYMGASGYGTDSLVGTMDSAKALPTTLGNNGGTLTNTWGGGVLVTGATNQFTISYTGVPNDACITLLSGGSGWRSVSVDGGTAVTVTPIAIDTAAATCVGDGERTIVWTAS